MHQLLLDVLDAVETCEMRQLSWGIVDTALSGDELVDIVDPRLDACLEAGDAQYVSPDEVIAAMLAARVLHATPEGGYRSRLAEGVRLMQRLRQTFAVKGNPQRGDWEGAPTLVADFRIARRPRRYPRRDRDISELLQPLTRGAIPESIADGLRALAVRDGQSLRLAGFQCRATQRILEGLRRADQRATVVCAGTGSGKTIAFYLPVLSYLSSLVSAQDPVQWVKAVALYPRNELLKDQLAEVYAQARALDETHRSRGARKLTVGAYFGPAPRDTSNRALERAKWKRTDEGHLCEYIRCPAGCDGSMIWRDTDRAAGRERLYCEKCGGTVHETELRLTRQRIEREPPDVLFTSTEMLNRRLSDSRARHLFGVGVVPGRGPRAVLLDEAHTYTGTHGAQVAYLLRRWRALSGVRMSWVGLSATLRDAARFFQDLTGLAEQEVAEVSPLTDEFEEEGAEYMIALRGDPASRSSLLSTTIQASMLLARLQDRRAQPCSEGTYANRTFVFTDDIDVTNRLYFDLLDAEGRDSFGNVNSSRSEGGLAVLRSPEPLNSRRYLYGQDWRLVQDIGHKLSERLVISRTSSQDAGVDRAADVIVATAALEVGFNDPTVGAVLQHKAPRDTAQYLQRKGRAGRQRQTRPWTVVVLSDYGRDRVAYQNYQALFDPLLPPVQLPVRNRNVLRMQAVYAAIDFLRQRVLAPGSVWTALSGPADYAPVRTLQQELADAVCGLLRDPAQAEALQHHIASGLQLSTHDLLPLLWGYPRPLLLAALPTALRRLESGWQGAAGPASDLAVIDSPLPDFVPSSLFSDLNLPEVTIDAPPQYRGGAPERHAMPMLQALRQFAPGRVSRRFGIVHRHVAHWIAVPLGGESCADLELSTIGHFTPLGRFDVQRADGQVVAVPVELPRTFAVKQRPPEVSDSSNADLDWRTQIVPPAQAVSLSLPRDGGACSLLASLDVYAHQNLNPLEVRRFASASTAKLQFRDGRDPVVRVNFVRNGVPTALGYALLVDGIRFRIHFPEQLWQEVDGHATPKWRALRIQRYRDRLLHGDVLAEIENDFVRVRLGEVFLNAACNAARRDEVTLRDAADKIASDGALVDLLEVLDLTLQQASPDDGSPPSSRQERLRSELVQLLSGEPLRQALLASASVLWTEIDVSWERWLRQTYRDTLAASIARAVVDACPGVDASQLLVDTDPGPRPGQDLPAPDDEVWITETTVGGAGIVEQFIASYAADPRRFSALLDRALDISEWEQIDTRLRRLANALESREVPALCEAIARFRDAGRADEATQAFGQVRHALSAQGYGVSHSFVASLVNRLLRPGSSSITDAFVAWAMREWEALEHQLEVELDLSVVAPMLATSSEVEAVLGSLPHDSTSDHQAWRSSVVASLLWPRGGALRSGGLETWNPFRPNVVIERWLVAERVQRSRIRVTLDEDGWEAKVLSEIARRGQITAVAELSQRARVAQLCTLLASHPVESDYLLVYARIRALRIETDRIEIDAEIAEAAQ
ncbi:protein DpdJ [Variovorax guangxiensis]|nr:protein DpdJ [Variovorax guangxiensis]